MNSHLETRWFGLFSSDDKLLVIYRTNWIDHQINGEWVWDRKDRNWISSNTVSLSQMKPDNNLNEITQNQAAMNFPEAFKE